MIKTFWKIALGLLCLSSVITSVQAAPTVVATIDGAVVWANPPAAATGAVEEDTIDGGAKAAALKVDISAKAPDPNDVQILSQQFHLTNGQQYILTYQAKSDAPRTIPLAVRINSPDWHAVGYSDPQIHVGTSWHMFSQTFTAANVGDGNNVVALSVGDQVGTVWIAALKLTTDQAVAATAAPQTAANAGKNTVATFVGAVVWTGAPASAAGSLENDTIGSAAPVKVLRVDITAKATDPNDVQVYSMPFSLTNGQKYTLTYDAKTDAPRTGIADVRVQGGDYHTVGYSDEAVPFGPEWRTYTETFTAQNAGGGNNVVAFCIGTQIGSLWIANLKVTTDGPVNQSELPGSPGGSLASIPKNAYRVLFVGNSITQHGVATPLGWDHVSGMAASSQSKDYVHLLVSKIQATMPNRPVAIRIASLIPGGMGSPDYRLSTVEEESDGYNPALVIIQHGEHEQEPLGADAIANTYNKLLDMFTKAPSHPKIVCVGVWSSEIDPASKTYTGWSATVDQTMHDICVQRGIPYISVAGIAADPADHGFGTDPGVQWHPNDNGQAKYAEMIFAALHPMLEKS